MVELGPRVGDHVAIIKGLHEGDLIITGNLQRISPGLLVSPTSARLPVPKQKTPSIREENRDIIATLGSSPFDLETDN